MKNFILLFILSAGIEVCAQERLPIIDMHVHCYDNESYFIAPDMYGTVSPENTDAHLKQTYEMMKKYNIVKAVIFDSNSRLPAHATGMAANAGDITQKFEDPL
jgi:hypothetical protein